MEKFISSVRDFVKNICVKIGDAVNLPPKTVGWIGLGVICALIILCVVLIVVTARKGKNKDEQQPQAFAKPATCTEAAADRARVIVNTPVVPVEEPSSAPAVEQLLKEHENKVDEEPTQQQAEVVKEDEQITNTVEEKPVVEQEKPTLEQEKPAKAKPATATKPAKAKPKKADDKKGDDASVKPAKKLNGKWTVEIKSEGEFMSKLLASNGEVMLSSEIYTTEDGARNGINTIIKGVDNGKFIIYQDKNNNYYYKLKTANNRILCVGEIYKSKDQCLKAVETVKRIAKDSPVSAELFSGAKYIDYIPAPLEPETKKGARGKWKIETTESGAFSAKLYANNGQLMLATEEVSLRKSAENALASVKKNSAEGNFIIDKDKFGRFYYKLRNAQKSVVCIGEAYDSLESCTSAIESVRRFAANATIVTEE